MLLLISAPSFAVSPSAFSWWILVQHLHGLPKLSFYVLKHHLESLNLVVYSWLHLGKTNRQHSSLMSIWKFPPEHHHPSPPHPSLLYSIPLYHSHLSTPPLSTTPSLPNLSHHYSTPCLLLSTTTLNLSLPLLTPLPLYPSLPIHTLHLPASTQPLSLPSFPSYTIYVQEFSVTLRAWGPTSLSFGWTNISRPGHCTGQTRNDANSDAMKTMTFWP